MLQKIRSSRKVHRLLRSIGKGKRLDKLTFTQEMFVHWNAERLNISIDESRERYLKSWMSIPNGHGGKEFRLYCELSQNLFKVFVDDNQGEVFNSYKFHGHLHFLRMLSYAEPVWHENDPLVRELIGRSKITILDFGCGLAQMSRTLAYYLLQKGIQVELVLADIPTYRKEFLLWLATETNISTSFLDCTVDIPIPDLPECDVCFALEFFEHVFEPLCYFDRIHNALSKDGLIITNISDHEAGFMHVSPNLEQLRIQTKKYRYKEILPNRIYRKNGLKL